MTRTSASVKADTKSKSKAKIKTAAKTPAKKVVKTAGSSAKKATAGKPTKTKTRQVLKANATAKATVKQTTHKTKKTKKVASAKPKVGTKTKSAPLILSATRTKGQSITNRIGAHLPDSLKREINELLGIRYRLGGQGKSGYDCSSLVQKVYADAFGIDLPPSSYKLYNECNLDKVPKDQLQTGDLLFFGPQRKHVNHVGIYLAGGYFFHAARSAGVSISRIDNSYWKARWMSTKRVPDLDLQKDSLNRGLARNLKKDSVDLAFAQDPMRRNAVRKVNYVEGGVQMSDSASLQVSGFSVNAFEDHPGSTVPYRAALMRNPSGDELQRGLRFSAVIAPTQWFKLIPSVTHYSDGADAVEHLGDYQRLGLETWMTLPSSRLALFMAASARNPEDLFDRPLNSSLDWESVNVALGVHYYLSESLQFSLKGTRSHGPLDLEYQDSRQPGKVLDDVSFHMNYQF